MSTASAQFFLLISFAGGLAIPYQAAINGLLNVSAHSVSLTRIAGIGLLAAGMYLVHRG